MSMIGRGALIAGLAGVGLLLIMFLSWFGAGGTGWSSLGWFGVAAMVAAILCATGLAAVLYTRASVSVPPALSTVTTAAGILAFAVVLYRTIDPPGEGEVERELGVYLGLAATVGITLGGWLGMQEERL